MAQREGLPWLWDCPRDKRGLEVAEGLGRYRKEEEVHKAGMLEATEAPRYFRRCKSADLGSRTS